jgi:formylglycine-generating enzyme required for sulfatase activity
MVAVALLVGSTECVSLDGLTTSDARDAAGDNPAPDATDTTDSGSDAPGDAGVDVTVDAACSGTHGPAGVRVGSFCIDRTEVTQAQYQEMLVDVAAGAVIPQPAECAFNTTFVPQCSYDPLSTPELPVGCVDWCDARAFCTWSGKRLCGHYGDGAPLTVATGDPLTSEWHFACTQGGAKAFPYGGALKAGYCNDGDIDAGVPLAVGTKPSCEGGFPGVFDLLGNVAEWVAQCDPDGGPMALCEVAGDSFSSQGPCNRITGHTRQLTSLNSIGIRCCAD